MAPFEALYGRSCSSHSYWLELLEAVTVRPEMIKEASKKVKFIQTKMKASQDHQKSYVDVQSKDLEFRVGELVYLKL